MNRAHRTTFADLVAVTLLGTLFAAMLFGGCRGRSKPGSAGAALGRSLVAAKEKADLNMCRNNLRQIVAAIEMYRCDHAEYPPWLSNLKGYVQEAKVFVCPADPNGGRQGGKPDQQFQGEMRTNLWAETWDFDGAKTAAGGHWDDQAGAMQNPWLKGNSLVYQLCAARCSWWAGGLYPDPNQLGHVFDASDDVVDVNADAKISWYEARMFEFKTVGLPHTPMVSCYWHTHAAKPQIVHVGLGNRTVFTTGPNVDAWKVMD